MSNILRKFAKRKVTVPSPSPPRYYVRAATMQGGGGYFLYSRKRGGGSIKAGCHVIQPISRKSALFTSLPHF